MSGHLDDQKDAHVASWSWMFNIEELSRYYRSYAIDLRGPTG